MKKVDGQKNVISLSGGKPPEEVFPIDTKVTFGYKPLVGTPEKIEFDITKWTDLNYNGLTFSKGLTSLIELIKTNLIKQNHNLSDDFFEHYDLCLSNGCTDGISKTMILLTNPKDAVFCAQYTYTGIMSACNPLSRLLRGVEIDDEGIIPQSLAKACEQVISEGFNPKMLYVVPHGQNPTSITMTSQRKKKIYSVCKIYDLIILVDDPYFLLDLRDENEALEKPCSFLDIDKSQRVVRLDSFSKIIAPGFRIGTVCAPKGYIDKFSQYAQVTSWGIAGINQRILESLLLKMDFKEHVKNLSAFYRKKRDFLVSCLNQISAEKISFTLPSHGLFIWVTITGVEDTREFCDKLFEAEKISLMPGGVFSPEKDNKCSAIRIAFSYATENDIKIAIDKLRLALD